MLALNSATSLPDDGRLRHLVRPTLACLVALTIAVVSLSSSPAEATTVTRTLLTPGDATPSLRFGTSVSTSVDGAVSVVGSQGNPGAAYIYSGVPLGAGGTRTQSRRLAPPTTTAGQNFGFDVAISGDGLSIIVGAPATGGSAPAAYVYSKATGAWTLIATLAAPTSASSSFGTSVAISGDGKKVVVGAPGTGTETGTATFFNKAVDGSWTAVGQFAGDSASARLGWSVALSQDGSTAAVGASGYKYTDASGKIMYYARVMMYGASGTTWGPTGTVYDPAGAASTGSPSFGRDEMSLSSTGAALLVGASSVDYISGAPVAGVGYLFTRSTASAAYGAAVYFTRPSTVGNTGAGLGAAAGVSPDGSKVILGQPFGSSAGSYGCCGAAWLWTQTSGAWGTPVLLGVGSSTSTYRPNYGNSVSASNSGRVLVGANNTDVGTTVGAGSAYMEDVS